MLISISHIDKRFDGVDALSDVSLEIEPGQIVTEDRVLELLRDFDFLPLAEIKLSKLSRGEFYKAALVALLTIDPELWLLDEPFASGTDPRGLAAFRRHAREAVARGRTVYSTQIMELAERFSDRACILHRGRIHAFGFGTAGGRQRRRRLGADSRRTAAGSVAEGFSANDRSGRTIEEHVAGVLAGISNATATFERELRHRARQEVQASPAMPRDFLARREWWVPRALPNVILAILPFAAVFVPVLLTFPFVGMGRDECAKLSEKGGQPVGPLVNHGVGSCQGNC